MNFCAIFEREILNFLSIIEGGKSMFNFDLSSPLVTANPRYAFDFYALCAETLLQLLHQVSPFLMETETLQFKHK